MSSRPIRTLLVEDNESYSRLVVKMLGGADDVGFDIVSAETLAKGISALEEKVVDLVLLDLQLPDSDGLKTFTEIHGRYPGIPVIVLTGTSDQETAVKALSSEPRTT